MQDIYMSFNELIHCLLFDDIHIAVRVLRLQIGELVAPQSGLKMDRRDGAVESHCTVIQQQQADDYSE